MQCWCCTEPATDDKVCLKCQVTVGTLTVPTPLRLADCEIKGALGQGWSGAVALRAWDPILAREVALKWFPGSGNLTRLVAALDEARAMAGLAHPNVVTVHRCALDEAVIVMQLVKGRTLQEMLANESQFVRDTWRDIALQISAGLRAMHQRFIQHSDLKPANILVEHQTNRVMIADFGLARHLHVASPPLYNAQRYRAPELWDNPDEHDPADDVFSLGVIIYQMVTGALPYEAPSPHGLGLLIRQGDYRPVRDHNPATPSWVEALIQDMLRPRSTRIRLHTAAAAILDAGGPPAQLKSIDDCQRLIDFHYERRNRQLLPLTIASRLLSAVTGLTSSLTSQNAEADHRCRYYFPRVLAWTCAALTSLSWSASEALDAKFGSGCPACGGAECQCRAREVSPAHERSRAVLDSAKERGSMTPGPIQTLTQFEDRLRRIYSKANADRPILDLAFWTLLEAAQVVDAVSRLDSIKRTESPEVLPLELADVLAWLFALADYYRRTTDDSYSLAEQFDRVYRSCPDCLRSPCECPLVADELRMVNYLNLREKGK